MNIINGNMPRTDPFGSSIEMPSQSDSELILIWNFQSISYSPYLDFMQTTFSQFAYGNVVWDSIKYRCRCICLADTHLIKVPLCTSFFFFVTKCQANIRCIHCFQNICAVFYVILNWHFLPILKSVYSHKSDFVNIAISYSTNLPSSPETNFLVLLTKIICTVLAFTSISGIKSIKLQLRK